MKRSTHTKKAKRQRGRNSHGWGGKKKHRGKGSRGGKGNAGSGKRADTKKPSIINLYGTPDFSKKGFVRPQRHIIKTITLEKLNRLHEQKKIAKVVNLTTLGYDKLLGTGHLQIPLIITTAAASKGAIEKVKKIGGDVIVM